MKLTVDVEILRKIVNWNNFIQSWSHNVPLMPAVQSVEVSGMVEVSDNTNMSESVILV